MDTIPFFTSSAGPPWLPASVAEARRFAYWGQLIFFVFFVILLVLGVLSLVFGAYGGAAYLLVSAIIDLVVVVLLKSTVFDTIDQGRFNEASDRLLIWGVVGLIFGILPGIFLIIAFIRIQDIFQPQYQPYPPQEPSAQYQPPLTGPQYSPPPRPTQEYQYKVPGDQPTESAEKGSEPATSRRKPKYDMVKCKKCGVQYPSFMRTCPNCNEPR